MVKEKLAYIKQEFKWKNFFISLIFLLILGILVDFFFLFLLNIFTKSSNLTLQNLFKIDFIALISSHWKLFIIFQFILVVVITITAFWLTIKWKKGNKFLSYEKKNKEYGVSEFLLDERKPIPTENLKKFNQFYPKTINEPFWIVRSKINQKTQQLEFNGIPTKQAIHALVIGSTGSGKTQKFIIPNAILNSRLPQDEKPSMVFTDPKGELFEAIGGELKSNGYNILKLNLREVMDSIKYNPLANVWTFFVQGIDYQKNNIVTIFKDDFKNKPLYEKYKCLKHREEQCWDCLDDLQTQKMFIDQLECLFFADQKSMTDYVFMKKTYLKNKAYEEISDLTDVLFNPGSETQNKSFYQGAQGLVKGLILLLLELKEARFPINEEQFNLVTITKLISNQMELTKWFSNYGQKHPTSGGWNSASGVINSSDAARGNYFSMAKNGLKMFEDESLQQILVTNDIDLFNFANKNQANALFLIIPDDRRDKHPIASLFISQLYKGNTFAATQNLATKGRDELDRPVLFFLDEFGNIPKISNFEGMITVSRSRRMYFALVIQDYQQLQDKYDANAETIKSNCPLTIYLKTTSTKTLKEISERMGETTVLTKSLTGDADKDKTAAVSMHGKALMEASDIGHLETMYSIILFARQMPSIVKFEFAFNAPKALNLHAKQQKILNPTPIDFESKYWFNLFAFDPWRMNNPVFDEKNQRLQKVNQFNLKKLNKQIETLQNKASLTPSEKRKLLELIKEKEKNTIPEKEN